MNLGSSKLMAVLAVVAIALSTYVVITTSIPNTLINYVKASSTGTNDEVPPPPPQPQHGVSSDEVPKGNPVVSSNEEPPPPPPKEPTKEQEPKPPVSNKAPPKPGSEEGKLRKPSNNVVEPLKPPKEPKEPKPIKHTPKEVKGVPHEVYDAYRLIKYLSSVKPSLVGDKASVLNDLLSTAKELYIKSLYYLRKGELSLAVAYARVSLEALHQAEHLIHEEPKPPPKP